MYDTLNKVASAMARHVLEITYKKLVSFTITIERIQQ